MLIDPRTTELRASLRAVYERSGRPPLDSAHHAEPLVSVVIPCYNYGYYLEDAILSAMMASSHPMEIVVVDDGSTDEGSLRAAEDLAAHYHFRLLLQRHTGQNGARYEGLRYTRGKFIQFLDADDLLAPGKIDLQLDMMNHDRGIDIAVCEYEMCDADGQGRRLMLPSTLAGFTFTADDFLLRWERGFSLPIHCPLFRRVTPQSRTVSVHHQGRERRLDLLDRSCIQIAAFSFSSRRARGLPHPRAELIFQPRSHGDRFPARVYVCASSRAQQL